MDALFGMGNVEGGAMRDKTSQILKDNIGDLVDLIDDHATLVVPADYGGSPGALAREIVRRGYRNLKLVGGPPSGYVADLLVGAGCVRSIEMPGVTLGDFGLAHRFRSAVSAGTIEVLDTTCPAFHASIAAARQGLPFIPIRGLIGSDVLRYQTRWKTIDNPYSEGDQIVLIPAFKPDVVIFHAAYGDRFGNVWIGKNFEVKSIAQAASKVIVSFERLYEGNLLDDRHLAPSTVSHIYVTATAQVARGTWPVALAGEYPVDAAHLTKYVEMAKTEAGFRSYLDQFVFVKTEVEV
jgi:glutaconate CoA-transferase subunit A